MVKNLVPAFRPSYSIVNGNRIYDLVPDKIQLVKYNGLVSGDMGEVTDEPEEVEP